MDAGGAFPQKMTLAFGQQIKWCMSLGSPFTAQVVTILADDFEAGGAVSDLVSDWPGEPLADAVPLRLAGALHALALSGSAPELAACYPPNATEKSERLRKAILSTLIIDKVFVRRFLESPPQTNEVGRSAVLVGGFHFVAHRTKLPLRLLEIGASAGLNLVWDRYRYILGRDSWGPDASPIVLAPEWRGKPVTLVTDLHVVERSACDREPIDLDNPSARVRLCAYVWADQAERLQRLDAAVNLARGAGVHVARADAVEWVAIQLAEPAEGRATVLYHSVMWQYLPATSQNKISQIVKAAGARSTEMAPLAWLRFEPATPDAKPELHLTFWPGEHHHHLAIAQSHGNVVEWL
jgi:hypothetical protein